MHIEKLFTEDMFPILDEEEQQKIIDTQPLHPMCKWYSSSTSVIDKNNIFVSSDDLL